MRLLIWLLFILFQNQLAACLALGSGSEYHFWLMTYVRYLVQAGMIWCMFICLSVRSFVCLFVYNITFVCLLVGLFACLHNYPFCSLTHVSWNSWKVYITCLVFDLSFCFVWSPVHLLSCFDIYFLFVSNRPLYQ